jgi:hypothetical protein
VGCRPGQIIKRPQGNENARKSVARAFPLSTEML